ncbi:MAG: PA14 domain-containing protein [Chloroflexota bacterium]
MSRLVVLGLLYLVVPSHGLGWLGGLPLDPPGLATFVAIGIASFALAGTALPQRPAYVLQALLVLEIVFRVGLSQIGLTYGLPGWYFANGRFQAPHERSTDFPRAEYTRRDGLLRFGGDEMPVYFLNDVVRFNLTGAEADRRRTLPYSIRWDGWLQVPQPGRYTLWLTASGPATLGLDGRQVAAVDADGRDTRAYAAELTAGSHPLQITYARRPQRSPDVRVEWDLGGRRQSLAVPYLVSQPADPDAWQRDQTLGLLARGTDLAFGATLAIWLLLAIRQRALTVWRAEGPARWRLLEQPLLGVWLGGIYLHAAIPLLDEAHKMLLLGGGQDWLTHESFARDILLNGPLMTLGKPLGEGRTFYAQPFYPYALAAMHWLTGEDLYGTTLLQLFGLGVAGVLLYYLAKRLFGWPTAVTTLVIFAGLRHSQLDWVSRKLLSEAVYFVVLPATLLALVLLIDRRRRRDAALAGLLMGLAIVTRGPTLLYLALATVIVWRALAGAARRTALTGLFLAATFSMVLLVPLRNQIVAGQPSLVASSGGVNLEKHHRPTSVVRTGEATRRWYAPYVQDIPTREVLEFIIQDPLGYAATYPPLAAYVLGYGAAIDESQITWWPDLVALNLLYLAAIITLPAARTSRALLLHAFILVHFVTMVVFTPYDYDNRLVLPMYLPIAVFAAHAVTRAAGNVTPYRG